MGKRAAGKRAAGKRGAKQRPPAAAAAARPGEIRRGKRAHEDGPALGYELVSSSASPSLLLPQLRPQCAHGPMLLFAAFEKQNKRPYAFFACSVYRGVCEGGGGH